jgi:hypothetical protein
MCQLLNFSPNPTSPAQYPFDRLMPPRMLESAVLPRIHSMRLRIAKAFNELLDNYFFCGGG